MGRGLETIVIALLSVLGTSCGAVQEPQKRNYLHSDKVYDITDDSEIKCEDGVAIKGTEFTAVACDRFFPGHDHDPEKPTINASDFASRYLHAALEHEVGGESWRLKTEKQLIGNCGNPTPNKECWAWKVDASKSPAPEEPEEIQTLKVEETDTHIKTFQMQGGKFIWHEIPKEPNKIHIDPTKETVVDLRDYCHDNFYSNNVRFKITNFHQMRPDGDGLPIAHDDFLSIRDGAYLIINPRLAPDPDNGNYFVSIWGKQNNELSTRECMNNLELEFDSSSSYAGDNPSKDVGDSNPRAKVTTNTHLENSSSDMLADDKTIIDLREECKNTNKEGIEYRLMNLKQTASDGSVSTFDPSGFISIEQNAFLVINPTAAPDTDAKYSFRVSSSYKEDNKSGECNINYEF